MAKSKKPKGSPFTLHPNGQWVKKIRGRLHYFGKDHAEALTRYHTAAVDLHAGRSGVRLVPPGELTLARLADAWLDSKHVAMSEGRITERVFREHVDLCKMALRTWGQGRLVVTLGPMDFSALRARMARQWGVSRLALQVGRVRGVFNWAYKNRLIDHPAHYGTEFDRPGARELRLQRATRGRQLFTPAEVRSLLERTSGNLHAMILLGINGGYGSADCSSLAIDEIDFSAGIIENARRKTGIERDVPLWPETAKALRAIVGDRTSGPVFVTRFGAAYKRDKVHRDPTGNVKKVVAIDMVKTNFRDLDPRLPFYALRKTFYTIARETGDADAVSRIAGHAIRGMAGVYTQSIGIDRLRRVVDHVRSSILAPA